MSEVFVAYRRRWFMRHTDDLTWEKTGDRLEVPVAVCLYNKDVKLFDVLASANGHRLWWEQVSVRTKMELANPACVFIRFCDFVPDKASPYFWQFVDPVAIEAFIDEREVQEAITEQTADSPGVAKWGWNQVIKFDVPWASPFLSLPFSETKVDFMDFDGELTI